MYRCVFASTSAALLLLQKVASYLKLARIHNMVPSMLLVVVGAWVSLSTTNRHARTSSAHPLLLPSHAGATAAGQHTLATRPDRIKRAIQ